MADERGTREKTVGLLIGIEVEMETGLGLEFVLICGFCVFVMIFACYDSIKPYTRGDHSLEFRPFSSYNRSYMRLME